MLNIRTILHPTDFSGHSDNAFRLACSLARDYDARLVLMHVSMPPVVMYGEGVFTAQPEEYQIELESKLKELQNREPTVTQGHFLVEGDPASEIIRAAKEKSCDLIVMGTHGRTGLGRLVMGSVAEEVVRKASCPVITLKTPFIASARGSEENTREPALTN